jgi:hypothetical protein
LDPREPLAQIPADLARQLGLPALEGSTKSPDSVWQSYAIFEHEGHSSIGSAVITNETPEVIGFSTLTGLCLEIDRQTGELRKFQPLLL